MNTPSREPFSDLGGDVPQSPPHDGGSGAPQPRLLDRVRGEIRSRHYAIRTEDTYVYWIRRFILFHGKRHPQEMAAAEVSSFLTHLAAERNVAAATQNQAKAALLFLYGQVLKIELPWLDEVVTGQTQRKLPVVLTPAEVRRLFLEEWPHRSCRLAFVRHGHEADGGAAPAG